MAEALSWFRLVLDEKGKMLSCTRVESEGAASERVHYVQAVDEEAANRAAFNRYYRLRQREHRKRLDREQRCECGRPRDVEGQKTCSRCAERNRTVYHKRRAARARGETLEKLDVRATRSERRAADAQVQRLEFLEEIDAIWAERGTVGLRVWLRKELRALREKAVA